MFFTNYLKTIISQNKIDKIQNVEKGKAVLAEVRADVKELLEMITDIPCTCDKMFTDRGLCAPDCPRCNWIEDDIVNKVIEHFS